MDKRRLIFISSVVLNVVLGLGIVFGDVQTYQSQKQLDKTWLPPKTYVGKHDEEKWAGDDPRGYYLFSEEDHSIKVMTFQQKQLLKADYVFVGNGVYELEDDLGFIVVNREGIELKLNEKNPLIFAEYVVYSE